MAVKISSLELENVKRVKAVALEPRQDGLTVVGGRNDQGKTSVLDGIAWALGGEKMRPSNPKREGAVNDPSLHVELSNGVVVERKGKNGSLRVTDPTGARAGQTLLNSFVEQFALDLPKFMEAPSAKKAETLLKIIGVGDRLAELDAELKRLCDERLAVGQMQRRKQGAADDMPEFPDAPSEPVSAAELVRRQQAILAKNGENQRLRDHAGELTRQSNMLTADVSRLRDQLAQKEAELARVRADLETASKTAAQLQDESTVEIEAALAEVDEINEKVRTNQRKAEARAEADVLKARYEQMDAQVEAVRADRAKLLDGAKMPLPGLDVVDGELVYQGAKWDSMSGSGQLKVATAIVRELNPECGFVLVDKLEQFDPVTLAEFGSWAEDQGLQVIGTRVAVDETCTVVIEDGMVASARQEPASSGAVSWADGGAAAPAIAEPMLAPAVGAQSWEAGRF